MKLLRYLGAQGAALGMLEHEAVRPIGALGFASMLEIIREGSSALERIARFADMPGEMLALDAVRLLAPIERPGKYLGIGMNYGKHRAEADRLGIARTEYQTWFNKQTTCLNGPFDDVDPGVSKKLDYEVELGVVIGKAAKSIAPANALDHVFGYVVANDFSARDWQFHTPTIMIGKSFDTLGPIGPWIVTADEIPDPQKLRLRCFVNAEIRQDSNTSEMIATVSDQIAYLSTAFTLEPGDLLATGTPEGVGVGMEPPVFLKAGDVVRCEIDGIGAIENRVAPRARR